MSATLRALRSLATESRQCAKTHDARAHVFETALSWANVLPLRAVLEECTKRSKDATRSAVERQAYLDLVFVLENPAVELER